MDKNYQAEPVQGATVDSLQKQLYDTAMVRYDEVSKKRDTLKAFCARASTPA
jgi:hypothetical protein